MGARVVAYDPYRPTFDLPGPFEWLEIDQVFEQSDILSLHCPLPPDKSAIVDARRLSLMKPRSVLVNTARALLIEETAVLSALDDGTLSVFATDVFSQEPPPPGSLANHPKVVATSHIGGYTLESVSKSTRIAVANLLIALGPAQ
jgi:D-3-phosphoglycerate dehydrogenase